MKKIAIIGAGITGLAASIRLASKGHHVTLFEKKHSSGWANEPTKKKTASRSTWVQLL